jgi:hypothetical protein
LASVGVKNDDERKAIFISLQLRIVSELPINSVYELPINPVLELPTDYVPELPTDYVPELPTDYVPAIMNRLPEMSHHGSQINVVQEHSQVP